MRRADASRPPAANRRGIELPIWLPPFALGAYAILAIFAWPETAWRPSWDSAIYLLTAQSLAEGGGYSYLGEPFFLRPPGLSWLLSISMIDGGGFDALSLSRAMMACAAAAVTGIYVALEREHGRLVALLAALLTGCSPLFVDRFNWVLSDLPFLALLFPALWFLDRGADAGPRMRSSTAVGATLLLGACLLRTAGLTALPGVLLVYGWKRRGWARLSGVVPVGIVALGLTPWLLHAHQAAEVAPRPSEQLLLFDYTTALLRIDPGDPASAMLSPSDWGRRLISNGVALVRTLASGITGSASWPAQLGIAGLVGLGIAATGRRRLGLLDAFAVVYLVLILGYFTHSPRLGVPLAPICLGYIVAGLCSLPSVLAQSQRLGKIESVARPLGLAVLSALALLELRAFPDRLDPRSVRLPGGTLGQIWSDLERAGSWLRTHTPADARILAQSAPSLSLLSGRRVYTSLFLRQPDLIGRLRIEYGVSMPEGAPEQAPHLSETVVRQWELPSDTGAEPIRIVQFGESVAPTLTNPPKHVSGSASSRN